MRVGYRLSHECVRVHRLCRRLYPTAADHAAPGPPGGDGCPRTAAVKNARLQTIGYPCTAAGRVMAQRQAHGGHGAHAGQQQSQPSVVGEGKVIAVVPSSSQIVVDHKEIKGFMDAMTMGYRIEPPSLLEGVKAGRRDPLYH